MILFETLSQLYIILWIILCGYGCGLFFDIAYMITFLCNNNKVVKNILEFVAVILSVMVLFLINQALLFGQFRLYVILFFMIFLILEQLTLGKIIAKTRNWCYHIFKKVTQRLQKICKKAKNSKPH